MSFLADLPPLERSENLAAVLRDLLELAEPVYVLRTASGDEIAHPAIIAARAALAGSAA